MVSLREFSKSFVSYKPLPTKESSVLGPETKQKPLRPWFRWAFPIYFLFVGLVLVALIITFKDFGIPGGRTCHRPPVRKEWRTLSKSEQLEYLGAVSCLQRQPSTLHPGTSYYDDFVYTHVVAGSYSHYAAAFLAWHRLYVHNYESALRTQCSFKGQLPYWDWTLDSKNLAASPVWDSVFGFGGDGIGQTVLQSGRCVPDGPFGNTTRPWRAKGYDHFSHEAVYEPHCLTRGFKNDYTVAKLQSLVSPANVEATLAQPDYNSFFQAFEAGAHNAIPQFIRGDFLSFTAPNDPLFWLHHTQVDRLWWLWQQRDTAARNKQFNGPAKDFRQGGGKGNSTLHDVLPMGGLGKPKVVKDVLDTRGGMLCYRY